MNSLIQGLKIWAEHISLFLFKEKKLILLKDPKTWICIFTQSSQRCFRWVLFHPFMLGDQVSGSSLQSGRAQVQTWVSQSLTLVLCMVIYTDWEELINKITKCDFKSSFTPNYSVMHTHSDRLTVTGSVPFGCKHNMNLIFATRTIQHWKKI